MPTRAQQLADLCRQFQVDICYAFGSQAKQVRAWVRGEVERLEIGDSDVDIGVLPARDVRFALPEEARLEVALMAFFGVPRVDVVSFRKVDPFFAANIVRGERLYARDAYQADEFELYVFRRAGDCLPLERERLTLILGEGWDDAGDDFGSRGC